MSNTLHITSGDSAGGSLERSGLSGEVFVWHDILYDGPRTPGWPDENTQNARALFLEKVTAGGLNTARVLETLRSQYSKLTKAAAYENIVLWFDACLFDQSMLERAELEDTSANEICERLLQHYLALDEKPPQHGLPPEVTTRKRSIYVTSPPGRPRPRTKDVGTALHQCHP